MILPYNYNKSVAMQKYKECLMDLIQHDDELMDEFLELKGKILGCVCKNLNECYGKVIIDCLKVIEKQLDDDDDDHFFLKSEQKALFSKKDRASSSEPQSDEDDLQGVIQEVDGMEASIDSMEEILIESSYYEKAAQEDDYYDDFMASNGHIKTTGHHQRKNDEFLCDECHTMKDKKGLKNCSVCYQIICESCYLKNINVCRDCLYHHHDDVYIKTWE
mgnify:CR=1 FL=1